MADLPQTRIKMTLQEYLSLPETNHPAELINGELLMSPAPKDEHQRASVQILRWMFQVISNGEIRHPPTDLHLGENVLQPDIFWVSPNNTQCRLGRDGYWHGPPDLMIEILSPATAARDRGIKYDLYEEYGIREYWLIDPVSQFVEVYQLTDGAFDRLGLFATGQVFTSPLLGQTVTVSQLLGSA